MSRLLVITRPELVPGFYLAGVDAFGVENYESAQELIQSWWLEEESGLLFIDEALFAAMGPAFVHKMEAYEAMPFLTLPAGGPAGVEVSRKYQISQMIRRAVGVQITFKGEEEERQGP